MLILKHPIGGQPASNDLAENTVVHQPMIAPRHARQMPACEKHPTSGAADRFQILLGQHHRVDFTAALDSGL